MAVPSIGAKPGWRKPQSSRLTRYRSRDFNVRRHSVPAVPITHPARMKRGKFSTEKELRTDWRQGILEGPAGAVNLEQILPTDRQSSPISSLALFPAESWNGQGRPHDWSRATRGNRANVPDSWGWLNLSLPLPLRGIAEIVSIPQGIDNLHFSTLGYGEGRATTGWGHLREATDDERSLANADAGGCGRKTLPDRVPY